MSLNQDIERVTKRLNKALDDISDDKAREDINKRAGKFVAFAASARAPRHDKVHYVYHTPKIKKNRRAKRGSALNFRTKYNPGNLQLSIRVLSLKQAIRAVVGPRFLRRPRAKEYGRNRQNVNAFYAQMIFGSAKAFRDRVMAPALVSQEGRVRSFIKKEVDKLKREAARRHNL